MSAGMGIGQALGKSTGPKMLGARNLATSVKNAKNSKSVDSNEAITDDLSKAQEELEMSTKMKKKKGEL